MLYLMQNTTNKILFIVLGVILLATLFTFIRKEPKKEVHPSEEQIQINYTNEIAKKCLQNKNTNEENLNLEHGVVYLYFKSEYPVNSIQDFISKNNYEIKGGIYSELQGKHSIYLYVPVGEEFCWARELKKEAGVETATLLSTLRPD